MDLNIALIAFLAIFILNFVLRMPMPLGMLAGCVFYFLFAGDPVKMAAQQTLKTFYTNYTIIAIPLFIFAANVMNSGKVTEHVFGFAKCFVGHLRGGLGHVNVLASLIFSPKVIYRSSFLPGPAPSQPLLLPLVPSSHRQFPLWSMPCCQIPLSALCSWRAWHPACCWLWL